MLCARGGTAAPTFVVPHFPVWALWIALLLLSAEANAQRSYFRLYDQDYGLNFGEIAALAQDQQGFLWIGAHRGLIRFDGRSFVHWAPAQLDEVVSQIIYGPDDQLLVRSATGLGFRRIARGLDPLPGPDGQPLRTLNSFDFTTNGRLWAVVGAELWQRDPNSRWSRVDRGIPGDETPRHVVALGNDVVVLTDAAAWMLRGDDAAQLLLRAKDLWFATGGGAQPVWLATHFGRGFWRVDSAGAQALDRLDARALDLRVRGDTVWLALDRQLVAYEADGRVRRMGIADGVPSGGPLLVDHENSLWLGTFVGLLQFPEPDTWQWGEAEGLPSAHTYSVAAGGDMLFVSAWTGLAHLDVRSGHEFAIDYSAADVGTVCVLDGAGIWASDRTHLLRWRDDRFQRIAEFPSPAALGACAADAGESIWFATSQGLLRLLPGTAVPQRVTLTPPGAPDQIWLDADNTLRAIEGDSICRLTVVDATTAKREACRSLAPAIVINSVAQIASHRTWIAANNGVFEFDGERTVRLPGNHLLEGGIIQSLTPAPSGGWWAAGPGALLRIEACNPCAAGWEIRETPEQWQGLPGNSAIQARETGDGDLWIAGNRGVWRVPRAVRAAPERPPVIVAVRARVDAAERSLESPLEMSARAHRVELEFAALSFRDRSLLRFRSRLAGHGEWSAPTRSPVLQFAALSPAAYRAEMAASLDGEHWSVVPAAIEFTVRPPWYRRWWARLSFIAIGLAIATWIYRLRVAALLRVERERTRIAMDLHDELGTGLGSIGMLAGVAARDDLDAGERKRIAREIASVSGLLGTGLRSLVWSLRTGRAGIAELGAQIADHARRLFPGDTPRLSVHLPAQASAAPLPPEVRQNVLLFALEALHNIARHAHAQQAVLTLRALDSGGLCLNVEDDGCGFDPQADSIGAGLESMRRRAKAIGASFTLDSARGQGTRIRLEWPRGRRIA